MLKLLCYNCFDISYRDKNLTGLCNSITKRNAKLSSSAYRMYSIKRRGNYSIFRDSIAAFIRGRRLFKIQTVI